MMIMMTLTMNSAGMPVRMMIMIIESKELTLGWISWGSNFFMWNRVRQMGIHGDVENAETNIVRTLLLPCLWFMILCCCVCACVREGKRAGLVMEHKI